MITVPIRSFTKPGVEYRVYVSDDGKFATCTCPDFRRHSVIENYSCKHIQEAFASAKIAAESHPVNDAIEALKLIAKKPMDAADAFRF